jgi:hypothetical protein
MCKYVRKPVKDTIDESLISLNHKPWVNIIDLIDSFRANVKPLTFTDWKEFVKFTLLDGNQVPLQEAKRNEFLAPLLQDLSNGPGSVDPRYISREFNLNSSLDVAGRRPETADHIAENEYSSRSSMLSPISTYDTSSPGSDVSRENDSYGSDVSGDYEEYDSPGSDLSDSYDTDKDTDTSEACSDPGPCSCPKCLSQLLRGTKVPLPSVTPEPPSPSPLATLTGVRRARSATPEPLEMAPQPKKQRGRPAKAKAVKSPVVVKTPKRVSRPTEVKSEYSLRSRQVIVEAGTVVETLTRQALTPVVKSDYSLRSRKMPGV